MVDNEKPDQPVVTFKARSTPRDELIALFKGDSSSVTYPDPARYHAIELTFGDLLKLYTEGEIDKYGCVVLDAQKIFALYRSRL